MMIKLRPRWSMATILTIAIVSVIALVMVVDATLGIRRERAAFRASLAERGQLLASGLNDVLADYIYFSDIDGLRDVAGVVHSQPEVEYMRIFNREGRYLVTPPGRWPEQIRHRLRRRPVCPSGAARRPDHPAV